MADQWFRVYNSIRHDRKVCRLRAEYFKAWILLLSLASEGGGEIPTDWDDLSFELHIQPSKIKTIVENLISCGLIEHHATFLRPHNWNGRQFKSDVSTERVQRFRKRSGNVSETPPESESESEQITERPNGLSPSKVAKGDFEGFWVHCPKKVGKGAARKAYARALSRTAPETIGAGMVRYAASRAGEPEQFTVHPTTWLNADRWLDEAPKPNGTGPPAADTTRRLELEKQQREAIERLGIKC